MPDPLRIAVWPGMPDRQAIEEAGRRLDREIDVSVIASNEALESLIRDQPPFDLITPSDYLVEKMAAAKLLRRIDHDRLPHLRHLAGWARLVDFDPGNRHSVPLAFGTTGILFDRRRWPEQGGWEALFGSTGGQAVGLLEEVREVMGAGLIVAGHSPNDGSPESLSQVAGLLEGATPSVASIDSGDFTSPVIEGRVAAHQAWSGPAGLAGIHHQDLVYELPAEGFLRWVTTAAIPAEAPDPDGAVDLLAELMTPALAALAVESGGYSTPNQAARALLPRQLRDSPVLFPEDEVIAGASSLKPLDQASEVQWVDLMERSLSAASARQP